MPTYRHLDGDGETPITGVAWGQVKAARAIDRAGTAQGGAAGYITLDAGAPTAADSFSGCYVAITAGTGAGQIKPVASYNGTTKRLTIVGTFSPVPNGTSVFRVFLARRYAVQNVSGGPLASVRMTEVAFGGSDGVQFPRSAADVTALSCPFNVAAAVGGSSGSWAGTGAVYYRLTGVKDSGETTGSLQVA